MFQKLVLRGSPSHFVSLLAVFGLVVYVLVAVARWYIKRIRDADLGLHTVIEEHWEQKIIRNDSFADDDDDSNNYIISSIDVQY